MKNTMYSVLICYIASFISSLVIGLSMVGIPIQFSENGGFSDFHTTLLFSLEAIMAIMLAIGFPWFVRKVGLGRLFVLTGILRGAATLLLIQYNSLAASYLILALLGGATFFQVIICQLWMNSIPISKFKGTLYSIFGAVIAGGIAAGASLYPYLELFIPESWGMSGPFLSFISCTLLCGILCFTPLLSPIRYKAPPARASLRRVISEQRGIYAAIALCGFSFFGVSWYMVLYGLRNGMNIGQASLLLSMFMIGGICIDPLMSFLGEKLDRRYMLVLSCLVSCLLAIFLPMAIYYPLPSYILVFVWGGIVSAMYSLCLMLLEERLGDSDLLISNSAFSLMENAGGFIGLVLIGVVLSFFGTNGFGYLVIISNLFYFTYALYLFLQGKSKGNAAERKLEA